MGFLCILTICAILSGISGQYVTNLSSPCGGRPGCRTTIVSPVPSACTTGYILQNNVCTKSEVIIQKTAKLRSCRSGLQLVNNQCIQKEIGYSGVSPVTSCPAGYILNGNLCYHWTSGPMITSLGPVVPVAPVSPVTNPPDTSRPICPAGFSYDGIYCVRKEIVAPYSAGHLTSG
ncbi:hypothetical protein DMENIID0001_031240 [Sergentomyia squamirostris]